jgi:transcriptional regulator with XRE-family HTH domain
MQLLCGCRKGADVQPNPILLHFSRRLRTARRLARLSQGALAKRLKVGQDTISHYEQARCMPSLMTVYTLSQVLGVDVRYFLPDEGLSAFAEEERETLALLYALPPFALQYLLAFVRYFADCQQRRRFLTEEVFTADDPQARFLRFLERDLRHVDENVTRTTRKPCAPMHALVGFTSILLMGLELEKGDLQAEDLLQRIGSRLQALVRDVVAQESSSAT